MLVSTFLRSTAFAAVILAPIGAYAQSNPAIPPGPGITPGTTDPVPPDAKVDSSTIAEAEKALTGAGYTNLQMIQKGYDSVWNFKAKNAAGQEVFVGWSRAKGVFPMQG